MSKEVEVAPTLKLAIGDDRVLQLTNGSGTRFRLEVGAQGIVRARKIRDLSTPPSERLPMFECGHCERFRIRPDMHLAIRNHMARLHDFDAESEETAIEIGRAREISKDPGWRDRFAWEQRRIKLYREADKLRIAAIREDDLAEARKLRRRANELERKARER